MPATGVILSAEIWYGVTIVRNSEDVEAPMADTRNDTATAVPWPALGVTSLAGIMPYGLFIMDLAGSIHRHRVGRQCIVKSRRLVS